MIYNYKKMWGGQYSKYPVMMLHIYELFSS